MVRRDDKQQLNPEDFLDVAAEDEDRDKIMEIVRGVKGVGEDDTTSDADGPTRQPDEVVQEPTDEQWEDSSSEEKPAHTQGDTPGETENEEVDWEPEAESLEVLDDPVRMYLREIGRVRLLTSTDEAGTGTQD